MTTTTTIAVPTNCAALCTKLAELTHRIENEIAEAGSGASMRAPQGAIGPHGFARSCVAQDRGSQWVPGGNTTPSCWPWHPRSAPTLPDNVVRIGMHSLPQHFMATLSFCGQRLAIRLPPNDDSLDTRHRSMGRQWRVDPRSVRIVSRIATP